MTIGLTPQVVTEALYALCVRPSGDRSFVPTEIHLITTAEGRRQAELQLLADNTGQLRRFCEDYGLDREQIRFDNSTIHLIRGEDDAPFEDIRTVSDNDRTADITLSLVQRLTADPDCSVHVSLAGGRKTMGFYLGYALSLYGRSQDRLSHVLVDAPYEQAPAFFYPTPESRILQRRDGLTVDARDASVTMATIPYVSLRGRLDPALLGEGNVRYGEIVRRAQASVDGIDADAQLTVDLRTAEIQCGGRVVALQPSPLAWYAWFAANAKRGNSPIDWQRVHRRELAQLADRLRLTCGPRIDDSKWFDSEGRIEKEALDRQITKINKAIKAALGPGPAQTYVVQRSGKRAHSLYGLQLTPEQIRIID